MPLWISDSIADLSNLVSYLHIVTFTGLCLAVAFGLMYVTKRKAEWGVLCLVAAIYAIAPCIPLAWKMLG
jgi:hypothetical protein